GKQIATFGPPASHGVFFPSPDEKQLIITRQDSVTENTALWLFQLSNGSFSRFTFDPQSDFENPLWSPDGTRIAYDVTRGNSGDLYQKASTGTGNEEVLLRSKHVKAHEDWSLDGRYILYIDQDPKLNWDLWVLPLFGDRKPFPYLQTQFNEGNQGARFSPDAKWVVYSSDETGKYEVYVRPFPDANGGKWQISSEGGFEPFWSRDGKEIFYSNYD